ncbi:MAG: Crp/Fnr family transcriptional regulator [Marinobacter sp.]|uniref:Crp/Fnr family transcriptional regulator n=1 Tax=Marinobacter sp. TaxID=50741 RepID=UPI00299CFA82|nr:Crp/Fnr family transcriptional regulator [Marinobacter sp.]MDX1755992.1 Crp/Fnr family transcriptional regulator [Marinobacter sp.]
MSESSANEPARCASAPCLLDSQDPVTVRPDQVLINGLARSFGLSPHAEDSAQRLRDLGRLFHQRRVAADCALEQHRRPWANVYLLQHGVMRLFREAPSGKHAIHHFFTEGALIWPVFGRSRTVRNTLCLSAVTACTLWQAEFQVFRDSIRQSGEGHWARFALALTEELAESATVREFQKQTLSARQRYHLLLQEYPDLVPRVPDNQLASWLGVVPATFSRLKKGR